MSKFLRIWFICLVAMAVTRLPLSPPRLYYFDSVNFALALRDFNPALHQPQPPGYPLYVLLSRLIASLLVAPEWVFVLAGVVGGATAATAIKLLADRMFGAPAGWYAAGLLILNPVFWFGGLTNQVRVFLASGSALVALACWRSWNDPARRWIYAAAVALGLCAGFRPELILVLSPLLLATLFRHRRTWHDYAGVSLCLATCILLWLVPTAIHSGGLTHYLDSVRGYTGSQFHDSSLLYGASAASARQMFGNAVRWNFLGMITWAWCLFFLLRRSFPPVQPGLFLAIWFVPPFLFQALVHVADPDQTLATIPILCVLGAAVLRACLAEFGNRPWPATAAVAVIATANLYLFLGKPPAIARDCSFRSVNYVGGRVDSILTALERLRTKAPLQIVWMGSTASWRQVGYYLPDVPVLVVENPAVAQHWLLTRNERQPARADAGNIVLEPHRTIVFLGPDGSRWESKIRESVPATRAGALLYTPAHRGLRFTIDGVAFQVL